MKIHPLADQFPLLPDDEFEQLVEDIRQNGLIYPIVRDDEGQIIDGRNRLRACEAAGVEPQFVPLLDRDPISYILSANVNRRHLSKGQQAMAVALAYPELEKGGRGRNRKVTLQFSSQLLSNARTVRQYAPELTAQVMAGGSLDEAYTVALERKQTQETEDKARESLRRDHPDYADKIESGTWTLTFALQIVEEERDQKDIDSMVKEIKLIREQVGREIPLVKPPDLSSPYKTEQEIEAVKKPTTAKENTKKRLIFWKSINEVHRKLKEIKEMEVPDDDDVKGFLHGLRGMVTEITNVARQLAQKYNTHYEQLSRVPRGPRRLEKEVK